MVAGQPFKGLWVFSTGLLLHSDHKRFKVQSAVLFRPPFDSNNLNDIVALDTIPSFTDFKSAYLGQKSLNFTNDKCAKLFDIMKRVFILRLRMLI
jgi:hypothetical protein